MKDVKTILSKDKLSRTELSQIYKSIKAQQLNIPWIDLLRKTTRGEVISKLKNKLDPPKPTIKKSRKKSQLKQLMEAIKNAKPEADQYIVLNIKFTDGDTKYSTITPQKKDKIIEEIINLTTNKENLEAYGFSDAAMVLIKGKTIKEFSLDTRTNFEKSQTSLFVKNNEKRINKKRTGGFSHIAIGWRMNM